MKKVFAGLAMMALLVWYWRSANEKATEVKRAASVEVPSVKKTPVSKNLAGPAAESVAPVRAPILSEDESASSKSIDEADKVTECFKKWGLESPGLQEFTTRVVAQNHELVGEWYFSMRDSGTEFQQVSETSKVGRLYLAMAKSGQFREQVRGLELNYEQARDLFASVANEDPLNSAPVLYGLVAALENGDEYSANYWRKRLKKTKYFDSYYKQVTYKVLERAQTPEDLAHATFLLSGMPAPDMGPIKDLLSKKKFRKVARQIASAAQNNEAVPDLDYNLLEYYTAYKAMEKDGDTEGFPPLKELMASLHDEGSVSPAALLNALSKDCDPQNLAPMLRALKARSVVN